MKIENKKEKDRIVNNLLDFFPSFDKLPRDKKLLIISDVFYNRDTAFTSGI